MHNIFRQSWPQRQQTSEFVENVGYSIAVGDNRRKVDLMLLGDDNTDYSVGLVDLSTFENSKNPADDIVDYYFQLLRAVPKIEPVFLFVHELADERSDAFSRLEQILSSANRKDNQDAG